MGKCRHRKRAFELMASSVAATIALSIATSPIATAACPNEAFRSGPSAKLPDCRAYELVTPPDSNGRVFQDITPFQASLEMFPVELFSPSEQSFVFETWGSALRQPEGGTGRANGDAWQAKRGTAGWQVVRHVTPTGEEAVAPNPGAISADHGYNFVFVRRYPFRIGVNGSLAADGEADYLGDPSGNFELTGLGSLGVERLAQGRYISPGGEHVIFSTGLSAQESGWCDSYHEPPKFICPVAKLEPNAPPAGTGAIYDRPADGPTHVVSLLPGDVTPAAGQNAIYQGASADGSSVAFKVGGTLYVRADNGGPDAETQEVTNGLSTFGGISADGTYLFYVAAASALEPHRGDIHRFDTETEEDEVINLNGVTPSGDATMVNVSADGSHVYFISPSQLDGAKGVAGEPNMYVWNGGSPRYIATVDPEDTTDSVALTNWTKEAVSPKAMARSGPGLASSRTTPDGSVLVFESRAQLTPYDNAGHVEIYRYDDEAAGSESLLCVSCNPDGTPAIADARLQSRVLEPSTIIRNLTDDGGRTYFETSEALVEGDLDNVNDVYEWQVAGVSPALALISSGNAIEYAQENPIAGAAPNLLMGVSPDGGDVFFRSLEPLVPGAPVGGAPAIYDARVGGGFPPPPPPPPPCLDLSACHLPPPPPPPLQSSLSQSLVGAGNVKPRKQRRCKSKKQRKQAQGKRACQRKKASRGRGGK